MFKFLNGLELSSKSNGKAMISMDLAAIKEKIKSNAYECIEECLIDIECIYHNSFVRFPGKRIWTKSATTIYINSEIVINI